MKYTRIRLLATGAAVLVAMTSQAQNLEATGFSQSGFMDDYTILEPIDDGSGDYRYTVDDVFNRVGQYDAIMIDEPEIFIAPDSPYRGAKPKHMDALGEAIRGGIIEAFSEEYSVVEEPAENVMYLRLALTDLKLEKRKRGILGYTPIGLVGGAVRGAATTDIASKADLNDVVVEAEVMDSTTGEILVALVDIRAEDSGDQLTWEELEKLTLAYGRLMACRLNNARLAEGARIDCIDLVRQ
jgi:hypothetical protein